MLLSGLLHLFLPGETEKHMSRPRNVRIVGGILLALVLPAMSLPSCSWSSDFLDYKHQNVPFVYSSARILAECTECCW